jgi:hypothetical protein
MSLPRFDGHSLVMMRTGMSESTLVSRKRLACWTEDGAGKADTWVGVDFAGHGFAPTHYTLCNGSPDPGGLHIG